jgi:hypothetical protein
VFPQKTLSMYAPEKDHAQQQLTSSSSSVSVPLLKSSLYDGRLPPREGADSYSRGT